jgi:type VI protein secretion system component Hcp
MAAEIFLELISKSGSQVKGESTDAQFPTHIELKSFSMKGPTFSRKMERKAAAAKEKGKDSDKAKKLEEKTTTWSFSISKDVDKSTPVLIQTYSKNLGPQSEPYSKAVVRFRIPQPYKHFVFLELIFVDVFLTKYDVEIDEETSLPGEKISFSFKGVEMKYMQQEVTGAASKRLMTSQWPPSK